jgi:hypothetical protein
MTVRTMNALASNPSWPVTIAVVALALLALLVYAGIALPAIWSRNPQRRREAASVLDQILNAVCRSR